MIKLLDRWCIDVVLYYGEYIDASSLVSDRWCIDVVLYYGEYIDASSRVSDRWCIDAVYAAGTADSGRTEKKR